MDELLGYISLHPAGVSADKIARQFQLPRTTLNRKLNALQKAGHILVVGKGPATRYQVTDALAALKAYVTKPYTERVQAPYDETRLLAEPALSEETVRKFANLPDYRLDKRELAKFLIDFSCASSVLEGGTYSLLDTQALIEYGEKAVDKPLQDAFLVLNHKGAFEYLYDHMGLGSIYKVHDLLTSDHHIPDLEDAPHFLPKVDRGVVREHSDVDIRLSTYLPPFRPGTGYLQQMLDKILATADTITNPIQAAFYLLSRIAYLQPFKDGNKRTARAMCNVPLIKASLPPISFVDFGKKDYLMSMLAFYELGDIRLLEQSFSAAYAKSVARLRPNRQAGVIIR